MKKFVKDPVRRQCTEGVVINKVPEDTRIINKTEWNQPGKITVEFQKDGKRKIMSEIEKSFINIIFFLIFPALSVLL